MKRFVLDHNLSPNLARALGLLVHGDEVTCLKDLGWQADPDDKARLTAFFLLEAWSKDDLVRGPEIAARLLKLWPEISRLAHAHSSGTCFAVPFRGSIRRFHPQGKRPI